MRGVRGAGDLRGRRRAGRTSAAAWLLNDLAYAFLAFDGRRARSVLEVDGAREVAVELWSPSKVYGMAGWRVGFAVGNAEVVGRIRVLLDHLPPASRSRCSSGSWRR